MARTPEQGHTKMCLASAMIAVIENARDLEYFTDHDFRIWAQSNGLYEADNNLADGTSICICPDIL